MLLLALFSLTVPARLLVLDTLVPGQRLRLDDPPPYFRGLVEDSACEPLR